VGRLGIVGHRALDTDAAEFVSVASRTLLTGAIGTSRDVVAVSALAEGADTLFAEAALLMGVPLEIVRPFAGYAEDFATAPNRRRYQGLAALARREERLEFAVRSAHAYQAAMQWVVQNCDVLVAAWDGAPSGRKGGTAQAVRYARLVGRPVVHLDVERRLVKGSSGAW
jgi:hypothetical protein